MTTGLLATIARLPQPVADAIAAGEVVERPASVVKELCENAIDAGATCLDVDIEGGGTVRIRVVDNGHGIPPNELELAVARHATSKIRHLDDLSAIASLGFRGEALASIAAVSDLRLRSCLSSAPSGAELHLRAGEIVERSASPPIPGTAIEVCDLFFNTPARLRFLRQARTEAAAAVRVATDLALTHPQLAFTCRNDGRTVLRSPGGELRDAVAAVLGDREAASMLDLDHSADDASDEVLVSGLISQPHAHRAHRHSLVLVVNGRRVHNRALVVAVEDAYRGLLPGGRHPAGVIVVTIEPTEVDVNVHPSKREVRFRQEGRVFAAVQRACWRALQGASVAPAALPWQSPQAMSVAWSFEDRPEPTPGPPFSPTVGQGLDATEATPGFDVNVQSRQANESQEPTLAGLMPLIGLGQVNNRWLVASSAAGVVLIDPHAAHEKLIYADLLESWAQPTSSSQSQLLLLPVNVDLEPHQMTRLETDAELIHRCGFELEPFGPNTVRCTAAPSVSAATDLVRLVHDLFDELDDHQGPPADRKHRLAALIACHSAVRFGDSLSEQEQQHLIDRLVRHPRGTTCPHGRPTVVVLDDNMLRRAFARP